MAKILTCPHCGNNKNLVTNNNTTICSSCGYSWVSVSNKDIKSSEIKVVMDSLNHYKYTLNNYNDDEHTFPFYAINNNFIEDKSSNKNRLIKVNPLDEKSVRQSYVGVNRLKKSFRQRPVIRYSDNVDMSLYKDRPTLTQKPNSEKVVSDRTNQEYEISRTNPLQNNLRERNERLSKERTPNDREAKEKREHSNNIDRSLNNISSPTKNNQTAESSFTQNRNSDFMARETIIQPRPQLTERNPNSYIEKEESNASVREKVELIKKPTLKERIDELNALNDYAEKNPERFFREFEVTKVNDDGSVEVKPRENITDDGSQTPSTDNSFYPQNQDQLQNKTGGFQGSPLIPNALERSDDYVRPDVDKQKERVKKERLTEEQKEYKVQLKEREERLHKEKRERERKAKEQNEVAEVPLTYEQYQEKRVQNVLEAKEKQKSRSERIKTKDYSPRRSTGKYQRGENKYTRKNENPQLENEAEQNKPVKDYREKYLDKEDFVSDNFNRETLANHNISKKLRSEIDSSKERLLTPVEAKNYEKKLRDFKYNKENKPSNAYNPSMLDEMINATGEIEESIINMAPPKNLFGKNPRLSFFENLKINNDGTIKEDPLGLNQDYNDFFNKNDLALGAKKYNLKEIISEIKKRINKDKMSFNLVILIIIFGFFGMLSHFITKSHADKNDNKMVTELDIGKDFVNQIPTIDENPNLKGANGTSDALVISKAKQDSKSDTVINATSKEESQEILMQGKKNVASDLSLEELRNNKLADLDKNKSSKAQNTTSFVSKTMMYLQQKTTQIFSDVNVVVNSTKWKVDSTGKYFEINLNINNKSTSTSYIVKTLEITLLDVSGNVIGKREIYPNKNLRIKESSSSSIRIPKAPNLSASAYVKVVDVYVK